MSGKRRAFGIINQNVIRSSGISSTSRLLYAILCTYADDDGVCWPSNETLAESLGASVSTVKRALAELVEMKVIVRDDRYTEGRQTTSVTRLVDAPTSNRGRTSEPPEGRTSEPPEGRTSEPQNYTSRNYTTRNMSSPTVMKHEVGHEAEVQVPEKPAPKATARAVEQFEKFWAAYPHKIGKQHAQRMFLRAVVTQKVDPDCILAGLTAQLGFLREQKKQNYCPHPGTWLNAGRWDDEITPLLKERRRNYDDWGNPLPLPGEKGYSVEKHGAPPDPLPGEPGYGVVWV